MPLVYGNLIIGQQQAPVEQKQEPVKHANNRLSYGNLIIKNQADLRPDTTVKNYSGPMLVVDGKEKKISKQSAYILDMLTLDEE